jgi:hypothetical protein
MIVLGLPLGGKLKQPIPQCRGNKADTPTICQSGPPMLTTGLAREVTLYVPGADQRPKWAADVGFNTWIGKDGSLRSFEVRTYRDDAFVEILNSITGRFGQSQKESRPGATIQTAEWGRSDIYIRLLCAPRTGCNTTFISPAQYASDQRDLAARRAKDAMRSPAP